MVMEDRESKNKSKNLILVDWLKRPMFITVAENDSLAWRFLISLERAEDEKLLHFGEINRQTGKCFQIMFILVFMPGVINVFFLILSEFALEIVPYMFLSIY